MISQPAAQKTYLQWVSKQCAQVIYSLRELWGIGIWYDLTWCVFILGLACRLPSREKKILPRLIKLLCKQTPWTPTKRIVPAVGTVGQWQFNSNWPSEQVSQQLKELIADCLVRLIQKKSKSQIITFILKKKLLLFLFF